MKSVKIADNENAAKTYAKEYGDSYNMENGFAIIGVEHDATAVGMSLDRYTHTLKEYIKHGKTICEEYKQHILSNIKTPLLYNHQLIMFKTEYDKPVAYDEEYYIREFTDVNKVPRDNISTLFENYYSKKLQSDV